MSFSIQDFFRPIHLEIPPSENDYKQVPSYIELAKTLSHVTYQSVYLIDYYKRSFPYVSENSLFLCGNSAKQVQQQGYSFYLNNVPEQDLKLLLLINEEGFRFYNNIPLNERKEYSISYDFRLKQPGGYVTLINHKLAPLALDNAGNIWLALCIVSFSSNDEPGNVVITKNIGEKTLFSLDLHTGKWSQQNITKLNRQEREILMLTIQGFTVEKMAKRMFLSADTIKFHKRNLFKKLHATNITEAIFAAVNYGVW